MMRCSRMSGPVVAIVMSAAPIDRLGGPGLQRLSRLFLMMLCAMFWFGANHALAQGAGSCAALRERMGTPQVELRPMVAPLTFDYSQPHRQLSSMAGRKPPPNNARLGPVLGLTQVNLGEEAEFGLMLQSLPDGGWCAVVQTVVIKLSFTERQVMVAHELPRGSCIGKEVMDHEMAHVRADEQWLDQMMPRLEAAMMRALSSQRPTRFSSRDAAVNAARRPIEQARRRTMAALLADRERRQAAIDTAAEYRRVTRSCGGEVERYILELRPKG